jgi:geranylgeranyl diphosphate synthase type I
MLNLNNSSERKKILKTAFEERFILIQEKLENVIISGVGKSELYPILKEISKDWKDKFRPALTSLACEAVGGKPSEAIDAGLVFTLASAGFGIHDDIIDHSRFKHISQTVLGRYGTDTALLVGDLLIFKAWTVVQEMTATNKNPARIASIFKSYGNLSVEICEAEFMDAMCRKKINTKLNYRKKILWKSMAEIEACTSIGARLGNGSEKEVQALAKFGRSIGFIYRLSDEVQDCLNTRGDLPNRLKYESIPLPLLFAAKSSKKRKRNLESIIEKTEITSSNIEELIKMCYESKAFKYILGIAKKTKSTANRSLELLKYSDAFELLSLMLRHSYATIADLSGQR